MSRNHYLIAYDISNASVQHKILKRIKAFSIGGQKSFYECWMTKIELEQFTREVLLLIDPASDKVAIFQLDPRCKPEFTGVDQRIAFDPFVVI